MLPFNIPACAFGCSAYLPKNKSTCLMLSFQDTILLESTTPLPAHICTRSWPYLFIFILSFQLTPKIYPSMFQQLYMSTDIPIHQYTCSVYLFFCGITCTIMFQLIHWGLCTQIYPKINLPVYASLSSNHKDLPVCHHNYLCTCP